MILIAATLAMAQLTQPGFAQAGFALPRLTQPTVRPAPGSAEDLTGLPSEVLERQRADRARSSETAPTPLSLAFAETETKLKECLRLAETDPEAARSFVFSHLTASRPDIAMAGHYCTGMIEAASGNWAKARKAFQMAGVVVFPYEPRQKALLAALEGNAALAAGDSAGAVTAFKTANSAAETVPPGAFTAGIKRDYARALVAENKLVDAVVALAEARRDDPENVEGWLLSATLSRRMGTLAEAQGQIERAGELAPRNPEIGLEAGRIAASAGFDDAARKSWESVIAIAPDTELAERAKAYIARLAGAGVQE